MKKPIFFLLAFCAFVLAPYNLSWAIKPKDIFKLTVDPQHGTKRVSLYSDALYLYLEYRSMKSKIRIRPCNTDLISSYTSHLWKSLNQAEKIKKSDQYKHDHSSLIFRLGRDVYKIKRNTKLGKLLLDIPNSITQLTTTGMLECKDDL